MRSYTCFGVRFAVYVDPEVPNPTTDDYLPPGSVEAQDDPTVPIFALRQASTAPRGLAPALQARVTLDAPASPVGFWWLESALRFHVASSAASFAFVHAGVVALDGHALVIPGSSGAGKSTLVDALVRAGAQYLSDEYAVIDGEGLVHPFARPIALARPGATMKERVDVRDVGATVCASPIRIGVVADVRFEPGGDWAVSALSRADCALALLAHTVRARLDPVFTLRALMASVRDAAGCAGIRGEAARSATRLLEFVEARRRSSRVMAPESGEASGNA